MNRNYKFKYLLDKNKKYEIDDFINPKKKFEFVRKMNISGSNKNGFLWNTLMIIYIHPRKL